MHRFIVRFVYGTVCSFAAVILLIFGESHRSASADDGNAAVSIDIGTARGASRYAVEIPVRLDAIVADPPSVAGTQNEISFDASTPFAANDDGSPACTVNPAIDKNATSFLFLPVGCTPHVDCTGIRAVVLASQNSDPIPESSDLYHCTAEITEGATVGAHRLRNANTAASDPAGNAVIADGGDGEIDVVCPGDCNGDGQVSIFELIRGVDISLGMENLSICPIFDLDDNGLVAINEIIQAISSALTGCVVGTPTPAAIPSPTATPAMSSTPYVLISVDTVPASPNSAVDVPVRFFALGAQVVGVQLDLSVPISGMSFAANPDGSPNCTVNSEIKKGDSVFAFEPPGCTPGLTCTFVRAIVISYEDDSFIPSGVDLFSCRMRVTATQDGALPILCANASASPPQTDHGHVDPGYPTTCTNGAVVVSSSTGSTPTIRSPTPISPTPTRTRPAPTPTQTLAPTPFVLVSVGTASGSPGSIVSVPAQLFARNATVVGVQVDLSFPVPGATFVVNPDGSPNCTVNPAIKKGDSSFGFEPSGCTPGLTCTSVRAIVISYENDSPIADGADLFSCAVQVTAGEGSGIPFVCLDPESSPPQTDPRHERPGYPTTCTSGEITVD